MPVSQPSPVSPLQRGFFLEYQTSGDASANVLQATLRMDGEHIDARRMEQAWKLEAAAEPLLRTRIRRGENGNPVQVVEDEATLDFREHDLDKGGRSVEDRLQQDREEGVPIEEFPLWRVNLIKRRADAWTLIWTVHHVIIDGRSLLPVLDSVMKRYQSLNDGDETNPDSSVATTDFGSWIEEQDWEGSRAYWSESLDGYEAPNPLAYCGVKPRGQPPRVFVDTNVAGAQLERWRAAIGAMGVKLNTLVQGAWGLLLARYQRQDDILIGSIRAGRFWQGVRDERNGMFIANVPVRLQPVPQTNVADYLQGLRKQHREVRPHEHCPLTKLAEFTDRAPADLIGQTTLMFENATWRERLDELGPKWESREFNLHERSTPLFMLSANAGADEICLQLEFDGTEFPEAFGRRILAQLIQVIDAFTERPTVTLGEIALLPDEERKRVVETWNQDVAYRPDHSLPAAFAAMAEQRPDAVAVQHGEKVLTYRQMNDYAESLASLIQMAGTGRGEPVAVCMPRSFEALISLLGILKAGGAFVPIDPEYPQDRQLSIAHEAGVKIVLGKDDHLDLYPDELILLNVNVDWLIPGEFEPVEITPDDASCIIFTSGSTGPPKGVVNTHRGVLNEALTMARDIDVQPEDRVMQFASLGFDAAQEEIWSAWLTGARLVLRPDEIIHSYSKFTSWLDENQIAVVDLPTAFWHGLVASMERGEVTLPESVKTIVVGGETAQASVYATWKRLVGDRVRWLNTYGPTETAIVATSWCDAKDKPFATEDIPIGRPLSNYRCYIVDLAGHPVSAGVVGELWVGGVGVAKGYLNRPEMTAEKVSSGSLFVGSWGPTLSHRGSRMVGRGRDDSFHWTPRSAGEDPWLSCGSRRDRIRTQRARIGG